MQESLFHIRTVFMRELRACFATPLAAIFLVAFLALIGAFTFFMGNFFQRGAADLASMFVWMPWLLMVLLPALGMRLWAEERRSGMIELLFTMPVRPRDLVIGKFLAGWAFAGLALIATMPMWVTVNWLGRPDNGVILAAYLGSFLMAGAYLAIAACVSALTKNQVVAFITSAVLCLGLTTAGTELVMGLLRQWAPRGIIAVMQDISILGHFERFTMGLIEAPAVVFFLSVIIAALAANCFILDLKKAQ